MQLQYFHQHKIVYFKNYLFKVTQINRFLNLFSFLNYLQYNFELFKQKKIVENEKFPFIWVSININLKKVHYLAINIIKNHLVILLKFIIVINVRFSYHIKMNHINTHSLCPNKAWQTYNIVISIYVIILYLKL